MRWLRFLCFERIVLAVAEWIGLIQGGEQPIVGGLNGGRDGEDRENGWTETCYGERKLAGVEERVETGNTAGEGESLGQRRKGVGR